MKRCSKCGLEKEVTEFYKAKEAKDGRRSECKICHFDSFGANIKKYRNLPESKEKIREYNKNYRKIPGVIEREKQRKQSEQYKKWKRTYQREYQKKYQKSDKWKQYIKNKTETNIQFKLSNLLRSRLKAALKRNYKSGSAVRDLGCSIDELKIYLEKQFQEGMCWENHGRIDNKNKKIWNIDHKKPLSKFNLSDREQFLQAVNFTNLQPLWAYDNIFKGTKI